METFHHPAARRIGQRAVNTIDRLCSAGSAQALRGLTSTFQNSGSFIIPLSDMNSVKVEYRAIEYLGQYLSQ